jgi:TolB-like protein/Tfp pilus assembly protein PilF
LSTEAPVLPAQVVDPTALRASVAVLPFATRGSTSPGIGGEMLADELVAGLARSDVLQVVSRMSTASLDADRDTLRTVLQEVGARYVLTGRARTQENALGLYAELADATSGHVIWAEGFESAAGRTGRLDCRTRAQALAAVHAAVIQHEMELVSSQPLRALEGASLLLAAIGTMHRLSPVDLEQARRTLEHLLERWRRHPTANAWLAHLHMLRVLQAVPGFTQHDAALARAHATAASQADPGSPLVLALEGHACAHGQRNLEAAEERYRQALSARPQHSLALLFHAELLAMRGAARSARAAALTARESLVLEPMRYLYEAILAFAALAEGDTEAAAQIAQQSVGRNPRFLPAWRTLIVAQVESARLGEAHASQQQLLKRQPAFTVRGFLGSTAMHEGLEARFADGLLSAGAPAA